MPTAAVNVVTPIALVNVLTPSEPANTADNGMLDMILTALVTCGSDETAILPCAHTA